MIGFIGHAQVAATDNYNTPIALHILMITVTVTHKISLQRLLTSRCSVANLVWITLHSWILQYWRMHCLLQMPENLIESTASEGSILLFMNALWREPCIHSQATAWFSECLQLSVSVSMKTMFRKWLVCNNQSLRVCPPVSYKRPICHSRLEGKALGNE
jgi:hypothetical protein